MVHVAFGGVGTQVIEFLRLAECAERGERENLRLAAGEQAGAVRARRNVNFTPDRANLGRGAPIGTFAQAQDALADDAPFRLVKCLSDRGQRRVVRRGRACGYGANFGDNCVFEGGHPAVEIVLGQGLVEQVFHRAADALEDFLLQVGIRHEKGGFALGLAHFGLHLELNFHQRLDGLVTKVQRGGHDVFWHFVRAALDHQDGVFGASQPKVQVGGVYFLEGRVDDELAIDASHAHRAHGSAPRDVRDHDRGRGGVDRQHVQRIFAVRGQR